MRLLLKLLAVSLVVLFTGPASAFCGFYVSGADQKLFAEATQVVLFRDGIRTVLSMQNDYAGPPEAFAMVVPVPVVLQKENVKTLPRELFDKVDKLGAPRLVEYWEQDPCAPDAEPLGGAGFGLGGVRLRGGGVGGEASHGVKIEAQFTVGEYEIVVLSAKDSTGLETWLHEQKYAIPAGSEPYLRPYVQSGMKFFVAKVDITKVKMVDGHAVLSPLRFHYDSEQFSLPIRLGLVNSNGAQDLIVNILAKAQRYEVANYPNVTIPTNLDVADAARGKFGEFYAALFDATLERNRGAVVTEYAWSAGNCNPCPGPTLSRADIATLGGDVTAGHLDESSVTLTRLHARYTKESLGQDLVFRVAPPIMGGREAYGAQEQSHGAAPSTYGNNFQARYAIRHGWTGPVACKDPHRGRWGGPPASADAAAPLAGGAGGALPAQGLAFVPRGKLTLDAMLAGGAPALAAAVPGATVDGGAPVAGAVDAGTTSPLGPAPKRACGCLVGTGTSSAGSLGGVLVALVALVRRRRR